MAKQRKSAVAQPSARSVGIAKRGVRTGQDFANLMSALMTDLIDGRVSPSVGNATCNAGGKLLKVVEMTHKFGMRDPRNAGRKMLLLSHIGGAQSVADEKID